MIPAPVKNRDDPKRLLVCRIGDEVLIARDMESQRSTSQIRPSVSDVTRSATRRPAYATCPLTHRHIPTNTILFYRATVAASLGLMHPTENSALLNKVTGGRPMLIGQPAQYCRICAVLLGLLALAGWSPGASQESASDFQLTLMRQYGRSTFSDCRLDVVMFQERAVVCLHCNHSGTDNEGRPIPPLRAREELSQQESRTLTELVRASALYDGGHIGKDDTAVDGVFDVLKLRSNGRVVMVVTSGNPTFEQNGARRALLSSLRAVEKRLADAGSTRARQRDERSR